MSVLTTLNQVFQKFCNACHIWISGKVHENLSEIVGSELAILTDPGSLIYDLLICREGLLLDGSLTQDDTLECKSVSECFEKIVGFRIYLIVLRINKLWRIPNFVGFS